MDKKRYSMTLADGTVIEGLRLNGNNFISEKELNSDIFNDNCSTVIISDGENVEVHTNMELVQITTTNGEWWFVLRDIPEDELLNRELMKRLAALEANAIGG